MGLTRAFMYAGTPRVVASLWRVPDSATAALMARFYRALLVENRRPAEALRLAQESVRAERRWSAPVPTGRDSRSPASGSSTLRARLEMSR